MSSNPQRAFKPVNKDRFRRACGRFATGIAIAGVRDGSGAPHGLTVNSFTSVSLEPPLVLICVDHKASVIGPFRSATMFGISMLREDQQSLSERFARRGEDRFDGLRWHHGPGGAPLLDDALTAMECTIVDKTTAGDHEIIVGQVVHTEVNEGAPLVYFASQYRGLREP